MAMRDLLKGKHYCYIVPASQIGTVETAQDFASAYGEWAPKILKHTEAYSFDQLCMIVDIDWYEEIYSLPLDLRIHENQYMVTVDDARGEGFCIGYLGFRVMSINGIIFYCVEEQNASPMGIWINKEVALRIGGFYEQNTLENLAEYESQMPEGYDAGECQEEDDEAWEIIRKQL